MEIEEWINKTRRDTQYKLYGIFALQLVMIYHLFIYAGWKFAIVWLLAGYIMNFYTTRLNYKLAFVAAVEKEAADGN